MASKNRLRWHELPAHVRARIEDLVGGQVVAARNCPGGFSPGLASRLTLTSGHQAFVKAMDAHAWPGEESIYHAEARVAAALPATVPAPQFLGSFDDGRWTVLAFEDVDGVEPVLPWHPHDLERVITAAGQLSGVTISLPRDQPRLGGWAGIEPARLEWVSRWAAERLPLLIDLEEQGLAAAQGDSLVHGDLYPHNILLTSERVVFVDWPHARLGSPVVDLVTLLCDAAATGVDPEPLLRRHGDSRDFDAVLAAHAGFCMAGALSPAPRGLEPIFAAKLRLGLAAVAWLERRSQSYA